MRSAIFTHLSVAAAAALLVAVPIGISGELPALPTLPALPALDAARLLPGNPAQQLAAACQFGVEGDRGSFERTSSELTFAEPPALRLRCDQTPADLGDASVELRLLTADGRVSIVFARLSFADAPAARGEADRVLVNLGRFIPRRRAGAPPVDYSLVLLSGQTGRPVVASSVLLRQQPQAGERAPARG